MSIENRLQDFVQYSELKQLAYTIATHQQKKQLHALAVLSFLHGEGKTLFCAAVAMAYAEISHTNVLIVDTATFQNKRSLVLKDCLASAAPQIEMVVLEELKNGSNGFSAPSISPKDSGGATTPVDAKIVSRESIPVPLKLNDDFSVIKRVVENRSDQYGLILFDTAPIQTKNKKNIDPLMVARLSGASVLVVSRDFLDGPNVSAALKVLKDPTLNLIGLVSNEEKGS